MWNDLRKVTLVLALGGLMATVPAVALGDASVQPLPGSAGTSAHLVRQVRHQLLMLPYYGPFNGVFENLEFRVDGNRVELLGQVTTPVIKAEAEGEVRSIRGVASVANNIQVLPVSSFDDAIRLAEYRAIFGHYSLGRYALGSNPSIHIIVDQGNVTLVGVVANEMDRTMAYMQARGVPGVFSVTNELKVG